MAALPPQPTPKSDASPGLLAHVAVAKYADGLPLDRQTKQFARLGIDLPRNTLARHMIKVGNLIQPPISALQQHIQSYGVVQMNETPVQVLKESCKVTQSKSYNWVMKGGPPENRRSCTTTTLVCHNRCQKTCGRITAATCRVMVTPVTTLSSVSPTSRAWGVGLMCAGSSWTPKKRLPKKEQNKVTQALAFIGKLYQLDQAIKDLSPQDKAARRQADAAARNSVCMKCDCSMKQAPILSCFYSSSPQLIASSVFCSRVPCVNTRSLANFWWYDVRGSINRDCWS